MGFRVADTPYQGGSLKQKFQSIKPMLEKVIGLATQFSEADTAHGTCLRCRLYRHIGTSPQALIHCELQKSIGVKHVDELGDTCFGFQETHSHISLLFRTACFRN
jgi:hypothetical protein